VLSDLAGHAIRTAADLTVEAGQQAALELINVVADVAPEAKTNRAITELEVSNVPGRAPRSVEARLRIRSFAGERPGTEPSPTDVVLRGPGGDLESGSVEVVPGTVVDKALVHSFDAPGFVPVSVSIEPDALVEDDVRYAIADVRREVRALIVDGAPSGVPKEDEIFYLERALAAGAQDQPPPRVITADDLLRADLGGYDVVILAGVPSLSRDEAARLVAFVEAGGGLFITVAEGMDFEQYNAELGRVLPRAFRLLRVVEGGREIAGATGLVTLSAPKLDHPVMSVFSGDGAKGLLSARTRAYAMLEPSHDREATVLVEYEDGQPALIEGKAGKGRVMLLTTSIDRDLSDLPIRPAFLPLVRQVLLYLGQALSRPPKTSARVAESHTVPVPQGATRIEVVGPSGKTFRWENAELKNTAEVHVSDTSIPGVYTVRAAFAGDFEAVPSESFVVNVDPAESDLRPLPEDEARAVLTGSESQRTQEASHVAELARRGLSRPELIAAWLLFAMLAAFVLESGLTSKRS
jgi:hypothetical protein